MTLNPQLNKSVDNANQLIKQKEQIESQIQEYEAILRSHKVGMKTPLVDSDGFPRADIDVYAVRTARSHLARLYNDQEKIMNDIHEALTKVHSAAKTEQPLVPQVEKPVAFAKINGVAPDSPASAAGLLRGDLITEFGKVNINSPEPLSLIAKELPSQLNQQVRIRLLRDGAEKSVFVTPAPWEGKGLLVKILRQLYKAKRMDIYFDLAASESSDSTETQRAEPTSWNLSWSGIIKAVKQTSEQVGQVLKEDLTELAGDFKNLADAGQSLAKDLLQDSETSDEKNESVINAIDEYAEKAEQLAFEGISKLGTGISSLFAAPKRTVTKSQSLVDRMESLKIQIGLDENTYLNDPLDNPELAERFKEFQNSFDQIAHAGKIGGIVSQQPEIKKIMNDLVPSKIKDEDFWVRYFFQISELERQQAARELLMSGGINQAADDEVAWSSDDETPHQSMQMEPIDQDKPKVQESGEDKESSNESIEQKEKVNTPVSDTSETNQLQVKSEVSKVQEKELVISRDDQSGSSYDMVEAKESSTDFGVESVTDVKEDWDGWD
ncbi:26S proteasome non-ATPase regulatory subunit 9 [Boothiomyces macroporosus]|uniref:Probable 26S proteasome regulatory subunit p27 n=1 Tax=Boothiomyces macroporosus TaxID=261099 RepID=A0AAD5Y5K7_9FUNG|nr:26S proteasome non-ATPase regulatory subunit 9 [Boothiomyces macroporosus]